MTQIRHLSANIFILLSFCFQIIIHCEHFHLIPGRFLNTRNGKSSDTEVAHVTHRLVIQFTVLVKVNHLLVRFIDIDPVVYDLMMTRGQ